MQGIAYNGANSNTYRLSWGTRLHYSSTLVEAMNWCHCGSLCSLLWLLGPTLQKSDTCGFQDYFYASCWFGIKTIRKLRTPTLTFQISIYIDNLTWKGLYTIQCLKQAVITTQMCSGKTKMCMKL